MESDVWDRFARKDPYRYIDTSYRGNPDLFWKGGKKQAEEIFLEVKHLLPARKRVIEVGCGIGRILIPMRKYFKTCVGVDVSRTMLDLLQGFATEHKQHSKIILYLPHEYWYKGKSDLVYSIAVFQHIEDERAIADYLRKISRSLVRGGIAYLHFDARPKSLAYRIKNMIPDPVLPQKWQKGIRRIRRDVTVLLSLFERCGLKVLGQKAPYTERCVFILQKT